MGWQLSGAVALLLAALWLRSFGEPYLIGATVATVVMLATAGVSRLRLLEALALASLVIVVGVGWTAQRTLAEMRGDWAGFTRAQARKGAQTLDAAVHSEVSALHEIAAAAVTVPRDERQKLESIESLADDAPGERAVVLFEGVNIPAAAGVTLVAVDSLPLGAGIHVAPFYTVLYAAVESGDRRAVATRLLHAEPAGDRLAIGLDAMISERVGLRGYSFHDTPPSSGVWATLGAGRDTLYAQSLTYELERAALRDRERALLRGSIAFVVALLALIGAAWRYPARLPQRLTVVGVGFVLIALIPLNALSNRTLVFNSAYYFAPLGGPYTASVGALAASSALALLGLFAVLRARTRLPSRWPAVIAVLLVATLGPFLLRDLARGITPSAGGVSTTLWLGWEVSLFLAASATLLAGASAGRVALGKARGVSPWVAPVLAAVAALLAPALWVAPGRWPGWYPGFWIVAIAALALSRRSRAFVANAALVAAFGATTLVWGATVRGRVALAERDVAGLVSPDPQIWQLLDRFARQTSELGPARTRAELLQRYTDSDLASAAYPVELAHWVQGEERPRAELVTTEFARRAEGERPLVAEAVAAGTRVMREASSSQGVQALLGVPHPDGSVTTVVLAPRTRLIAEDPFTRLLGLGATPNEEPPYTVAVGPAPEGVDPALPLVWQRRGDEMHGEWRIQTANGPAGVHVEVELRTLDALVQRGALIVLVDLVVLALLWTLSAAGDGGLWRWARTRMRRWARSYRARLTLALFAFFVLPSTMFAVWSYRRLQTDDRRSRELLVLETLRTVSTRSNLDALRDEGERLSTPLFLFRSGALVATSDELYDELAPIGHYVSPPVSMRLTVDDEVTASERREIGGAPTLIGYRTSTDVGGGRVVLAATARSNELSLDRQRRDLGILLLFVTAAGALAALWLSGIAARGLARPIGSLRQAAFAIAGGESEPSLGEGPPVEFQPVFSAFRSMATDLATSREALQEAQRRTEAVLRNVASGVVATDADGRVILANTRAESLLDVDLPPGTSLADVGARELHERLRAFAASEADDEAFDLDLRGRQLRGRLARLGRGTGGAVLTLDDVTELAHAQRVLAWGEMARQVAHEIKNPLTPIRLGVQHLRRARGDRRVDFDRILEQNVGRILSEIDRLDEIARSFSRYGTAPQERLPGAPVDVAAVVRDVVELERLGQDEISWQVEGAESPAFAIARPDELREVLLNLLENSRHARARRVSASIGRDDGRVVIAIDDDGEGIPTEILPRIFEPRFSTRTSGSGLGLAISRQLVESWGGEIGVVSALGDGTRVQIALAAAAPA
jgi:two-component system, NtrC family, nitrogen regulation sensor histidine kinase NtrY